jgi:GNAT superfamily N-acetyltransferase
LIVRPATQTDLDPIRVIANSYGTLATWSRRPDYIDHELATGTLTVCEAEGEVVGFGAVLARNGIAHLADLFISRDRVGQGIGKAILEATLSPNSRRVTFASNDPRALPLYMRFGMVPVAPLLYLKGSHDVALRVPDQEVTLRESTPAEVADLDRAASARRRREDLDFLAGHADCFSAVHRNEVIGYGFVRLVKAADGTATDAFVGPVGAPTAERSRLTAMALLRWSAEHATSVIVAVFGPHSLAPTLVDAGYRIEDIDTYMASSARLINLERYCPSAELG